MSEISGPQTGNSYDKVFPFEILVKMCFVSQLKPGTIGKDLEGFHSRLDKSAPGAAEVLQIRSSVDKNTQIHKYTDTRKHRYTNTQIHKYTDTQILRYTDT